MSEGTNEQSWVLSNLNETEIQGCPQEGPTGSFSPGCPCPLGEWGVSRDAVTMATHSAAASPVRSVFNSTQFHSSFLPGKS